MDEVRPIRGMSGWPLFIGIAGAVAAALLASVTELGAGQPGAEAVRLLGIPAMGLGSGFIALAFAMRVRVDRARRLWALMAVAAVCLALSASAAAPGVSVPRSAEMPLAALHTATYVIVAGAALSAVFYYRKQVDLVWPVVESFVGTAAISLILWLTVVRAVTVAPGDPSSTVVLDETFLIGDLAFIIGPTLLLALALIRIPERFDVAPWLLFGASLSATVLAEVGWFVETGTGYSRGSLADFIWMLGMVGVAVAAGLAWDADRAGRLFV